MRANYLCTFDGREVSFLVARAEIKEPMPPIPTDAWMAQQGFKRIYDHKPDLMPNETYTGYVQEIGPERVDRFFSVGPAMSAADYLASVKAEASAIIAERRWQKEVGGVDVGGFRVKTDRESQAALGNAFTSLSGGLIASTPWKGENGWTIVTLAEITPVAQAVAAHVSACFAREKEHLETIAALATPEEVRQCLETAAF